MERRSGGGSGSRTRHKSILYKPRPPKDFIELLRGATEFSVREKGGQNEIQVRIGTSFNNSVAVPATELETLFKHLEEVLQNKEDMIARLKEEYNLDSTTE